MKSTIGILGGLGPEATLETYKRILRYCQTRYKAVQDHEYPHILINSLSLEGFDETGFKDPQLVLNGLVTGAIDLKKTGCDTVIMPCNTVHVFQEEIESRSEIKIKSLVDAAILKAKNLNFTNIGIVSSEYTRKVGLYSRKVSELGLNPIIVSDEEQDVLTQIILKVMAGEQGIVETYALKKIIENLVLQGATCVILGCTELPLAISQSDTNIPLIDAVQVAVEELVDFAYAL
jgi:aspartate racemase